MNDYERLINNTKHLLEDFDKHDLDVWVNLFIKEAIDSDLGITVNNRPSGGLIVLLAIFHLKDPSRIFAKQKGPFITICLESNKGPNGYKIICSFRLKNPDNPKASILEELGACGAPAGLFNVAKQMILNMNVFQKMPG